MENNSFYNDIKTEIIEEMESYFDPENKEDKATESKTSGADNKGVKDALKRKTFFISGDYGSGKTELIKKIKKDISTKTKNNNPVKVGDIDVSYKHKGYLKHIFNKRNTIEDFENIKTLKKFNNLFFMLSFGILTAGIGLFANSTKDILQMIPAITVTTLAVFMLIVSAILYFWKIKNKELKKDVWIIEDVDRAEWKSILKILNDTLNLKDEIIIFTFSLKNLEERYRERYGFYPSHLMFLLEKYFDKIYDTNAYKDEAKNIFWKEGKYDLKINTEMLPFTNFRMIKKTIQETNDFILEPIESVGLFDELQIQNMRSLLFYLNYLRNSSLDVFYKVSKLLNEINGENDALNSVNSNRKYSWWQRLDYEMSLYLEFNHKEPQSNTQEISIESVPYWAIGYEEIIREIINILRNNTICYPDSNVSNWYNNPLVNLEIKIPWLLFTYNKSQFNEVIRLFRPNSNWENVLKSILPVSAKYIILSNKINLNSKKPKLDQYIEYLGLGNQNHEIVYQKEHFENIFDFAIKNDAKMEQLGTIINLFFQSRLKMYINNSSRTPFLNVYSIVQKLLFIKQGWKDNPIIKKSPETKEEFLGDVKFLIKMIREWEKMIKKEKNIIYTGDNTKIETIILSSRDRKNNKNLYEKFVEQFSKIHAKSPRMPILIPILFNVDLPTASSEIELVDSYGDVVKPTVSYYNELQKKYELSNIADDINKIEKMF